MPSCLVHRSKTWLSCDLNWSFDVANHARTADHTIALSAIATVCVSDARIALSTLILTVSLVLLPGAVWMHAT